ncbi:MAG: hypothetical protein IPM42_16410 [Saprospiraceae bacterium]|nr:hypothetical protein [Saprospiraceae bacterium]
MENQDRSGHELFEKIQTYIQTSTDVVKLKALRTSADVVADVSTGIIIGIIFLLFFIFFNLGLALWIGYLFGHYFAGFFVMALFYGFLCVVLYIFKDMWFEKVIREGFIAKMLATLKGNEEENPVTKVDDNVASN